ncbi:MAG TPA: hypothetical protein VEQ60_12140 [Longimicrobium sp.]|nr:hypothetical protein [Longimicrobium sp.]
MPALSDPPRAGGPALHRSAAALAAADPEAAPLWEREIRAVCPRPGARRSRLAASGDPVEWAFAWPGEDLRLTCDPAPGAGAAQRLRAAAALCGAGLSAAQSLDVRRLRGWGADGGRYGGWVGSRRRDGRMARKLYVEIVSGAPWRRWTPAAPLADPGVPSRSLVPVMAGFDAESGGVEVYCRTPAVHPQLLAALLRAAGLPPRADELVAEVARVTGRAVRAELPGADQGVSLGWGPDGGVRTLTWYTHAEMLFGPAARTREAWLAAGRARGWSMRAYAALSAPDAAGRTPWHGLAGFAVGHAGPVAASVTCTPRAEEDR